MSLQSIRDYFKARILEVDPDFQEHSDAFNTDNIPATASKTFYVFSGTINGSTLNQSVTDDSIQVTVKLFYKGDRDPVGADLDQAMDTANSFRLKAMDPSKYLSQENLRRVFCNSVDISTRDKTTDFFVQLIFIVRAGFAVG